jgi:hypothetical protein
MELALTLAGEPFNDHSQSVRPVIGSFLRGSDDRIDDGRRHDHYAYAAKVVGSGGSEDVQHARASGVGARASLARVATAPPPCTTPRLGPNPACGSCRQPRGLRDPAVQRQDARVSAGADRRAADGRHGHTADNPAPKRTMRLTRRLPAIPLKRQ